jgi:putative cardiolipin synthase
MHNKLMVMDNALAIVGGRNMSDPYFGVDPRANFRDLDIAAAGPVVRDLSNVFDRFWNGAWSVPIAALVDRRYGEDDLRAHVQRLREVIAKGDYPHPLDQDVAALKSELSTLVRGFVWAPAHVVYDDPASISDPSRRVMHTLLFRRLDRVQTELLIESAYFIPLDGGVAKLKELVDRGVRIRVLTNSLASNDVIAAFAGYSKRREAMVRNGIELYELRRSRARCASGSSAVAPGRACTPRPSSSTARTCSSAASTSTRGRAPSTPRQACTWKVRSSPRR